VITRMPTAATASTIEIVRVTAGAIEGKRMRTFPRNLPL
jgi:hypothetical protein